MRVVTAAQMRDADARASARVGEVALMRAAGEALAQAIVELRPEARRLVAFAGPGNNGGDAFAAFAEFDPGYDRVIYAMPSREPSAARRDAESRAERSGVIVRMLPQTPDAARAALAHADVALDALLGTGTHSEPAAELVAAVDALSETDAFVIAVDLPTGCDATTGALAAHSVRAGATVTLGAVKLGLLLDPARENAGHLYLGDIGLGSALEEAGATGYSTLTADEFLSLLPARGEDADKRSAGAPLVFAGSLQFPGAAVLCARAAARAGAGYVTVAAPASAAVSIRAHLVEQVVISLDERDVDEVVGDLIDLTSRCNAVAIGPGLGLGDAIGAIVRGFIERLERPFVADASALFHLAKNLDILRGKACVVTPHEGEFARLSGEGTIAPGTRVERLRSFTARTGITTLLKGHATLIDDGTTIAVNTTGTNALATAGTGDVLSGMIATLLARGLAPFAAARAGAYWHGLAGQTARAQRSVGVVAGDLPEVFAAALPDASPARDRLTRIY